MNINLNDLCDEMLIKILNSAFNDKLNLNLVCKRWNFLVNCFINKSLTIDLGNEAHFCIKKIICSNKSHQIFLKTFFRIICENDLDNFINYFNKYSLFTKVKSLNLFISSSNLIKNLKKLHFILMQFKNLEHLELHFIGEPKSNYLLYLLYIFKSNMSKIKHLSLSIKKNSSVSSSYEINVSQIFLIYPKIETLSINNSINFVNNNDDELTQCLNLRELYLERIELIEKKINLFLNLKKICIDLILESSFKNLIQTFTYLKHFEAKKFIYTDILSCFQLIKQIDFLKLNSSKFFEWDQFFLSKALNILCTKVKRIEFNEFNLNLDNYKSFILRSDSMLKCLNNVGIVMNKTFLDSYYSNEYVTIICTKSIDLNNFVDLFQNLFSIEIKLNKLIDISSIKNAKNLKNLQIFYEHDLVFEDQVINLDIYLNKILEDLLFLQLLRIEGPFQLTDNFQGFKNLNQISNIILDFKKSLPSKSSTFNLDVWNELKNKKFLFAMFLSNFVLEIDYFFNNFYQLNYIGLFQVLIENKTNEKTFIQNYLHKRKSNSECTIFETDNLNLVQNFISMRHLLPENFIFHQISPPT